MTTTVVPLDCIDEGVKTASALMRHCADKLEAQEKAGHQVTVVAIALTTHIDHAENCLHMGGIETWATDMSPREMVEFLAEMIVLLGDDTNDQPE